MHYKYEQITCKKWNSNCFDRFVDGQENYALLKRSKAHALQTCVQKFVNFDKLKLFNQTTKGFKAYQAGWRTLKLLQSVRFKLIAYK